MDWVDKPQHYKDLYGILQLLGGSYLNSFHLKTLKLGWVAFHSVTFQLKCLDFQSNQYKKLVPVLSRLCNGLHCMVIGARCGRYTLWWVTGDGQRFKPSHNLVPRALVTLVQRNGKTKTSGKMRLSSAFHWPSTERAQFNRKLRNNNFVPRFPI